MHLLSTISATRVPLYQFAACLVVTALESAILAQAQLRVLFLRVDVSLLALIGLLSRQRLSLLCSTFYFIYSNLFAGGATAKPAPVLTCSGASAPLLLVTRPCAVFSSTTQSKRTTSRGASRPQDLLWVGRGLGVALPPDT